GPRPAPGAGAAALAAPAACAARGRRRRRGARPVTEDRFGDLGPSDRPEQSPAQRLAELDELDLAQERESKPAGPPPRPAGRYMWVVGVVFLLVVSVIVPGERKCEGQLDLFQRMAAAHSGAQFAAVVSGGSHAKVAALVRRHGWTFPVAVDRDLSVFNLYRVAVCPTTVFALPGGTVKSTSIHPLSEAQVLAGLRTIGGA